MTEPRRVRDVVRDMVPMLRNRLEPCEVDLGVHLRGNEKLFNTLTAMVRIPIERRARLPEPSDPLECKSRLARDNELRRLLARLELVYRSLVSPPANE